MNNLGLVIPCLAGWVNRHQQHVIEYLQEEVRVLKELHRGKRLRFSNEQRCRLAAKAKKLRLGRLKAIAGIVARRPCSDGISNSSSGIEPAPERGRKTTWSEFLKAHWEVLAAADFFNVEVWTRCGLVRYGILFVMRLATREVQIAGIVPPATGVWMAQAARNLTDPFDGFLRDCRFLIHACSSL